MRKIRVRSVIFICGVLFFINVSAQERKSYIQTTDGIEVSIDHSLSGIKKIRLQPVSDQIIHVTQIADGDFKADRSLMSVKQSTPNAVFAAKELQNKIVLSTAKLQVIVSTETGLLTYKDLEGNVLLAQNNLPSTALVPKIFNGEPSYQVSQLFDAQKDEAYYGLGQHQQGIMNYRGRRVDLVQYNTEIAVPFLISNKGYGLLWDNYSITRAGDIRDYQPLSALRLNSKNNKEGWLTASYASRKSPSTVLFTRPVSDISMNWLTDQHKFPDSIKLAEAVVNYEGSVESGLAGLYQLQLKYAGYIKVWFDGKLVANYWRQAWNPGSAILTWYWKRIKR